MQKIFFWDSQANMGPRVYALYATNRRTPHRNSLSLSHSRSVDKTHHISNKNHHIKALFEKHTYFFQSIVKFSGGFLCLSSSVDHELTNTTNCTAICGDGLQVGNEACDDGKSTNASARGSDECTVECGFVCDAKECQVCASECGDGSITASHPAQAAIFMCVP